MVAADFCLRKYNGVALRSVGRSGALRAEPARRRRAPTAARCSTRSSSSTSANFERFGDPETQTRIAQYEMAFRMQTSVPDLTDISQRIRGDAATCTARRASKPGSFAHSALLARRLVERGVRVVQILHRGWDQHGNLPQRLAQPVQRHRSGHRRAADGPEAARACSTRRWSSGAASSAAPSIRKARSPRPTTAATIIRAISACGWPAAASSGGIVYGETDDFSYNIAEKPVHVNDLNATILHCLGIDHERFTFKFQGLDQRLTGVEPQRVLKELLL